MAAMIQKDKPLTTAEILTRRLWGTVGNAGLLKVRVFRSPKGRQLGLIPENAPLTAFTEPVFDALHTTASFHKRRYAKGQSPNHNLSFAERRLGKALVADRWTFPDQAEFDAFVDGYKRL